VRVPASDVAAVFLRWVFLRAIFHRGWWLVTSLYLVAVAELSALQLVMLGTAQNLTALVLEVPTGVVADTFSRKTSIVVAHLLMGAGMLATGLVTAFPALVLTQMVWGLAWTFSSGADVAWLSDELDQPIRFYFSFARTVSAKSFAGSRVSRPKNSITNIVQPRARWRSMPSITRAGSPQMPWASRLAPMWPP